MFNNLFSIFENLVNSEAFLEAIVDFGGFIFALAILLLYGYLKFRLSPQQVKHWIWYKETIPICFIIGLLSFVCSILIYGIYGINLIPENPFTISLILMIILLLVLLYPYLMFLSFSRLFSRLK